jgi:hypothetical protein
MGIDQSLDSSNTTLESKLLVLKVGDIQTSLMAPRASCNTENISENIHK